MWGWMCLLQARIRYLHMHKLWIPVNVTRFFAEFELTECSGLNGVSPHRGWCLRLIWE